MILLLTAVFLPMAAAFFGYFLARRFPKTRDLFFGTVAFAEFALTALLAWNAWFSSPVSLSVSRFVGLGLSLEADPFRALYALLTAFLWLMTTLFSKEYMAHGEQKERYCLFSFLTLTGVIGVFCSADLFTTFVFFEIMSFASYPLVAHEETDDAMRAGETYLGVAVISGMMLLVGLFLLYSETGTLSFTALRETFASRSVTDTTMAGGILCLFGFGAKAGMFPLHIWLPKAHPVAPAPASALLSGILTKTGVFGIIVLVSDVFRGNATFGVLVLLLAVITMFWGAFLALFSVNLKRTLACSSMSQIGFVLVGVALSLLLGEDGGMAQCGALWHMVNHSLIKLVLFQAAGVVAMNLHALDLNDIRGFGRKKPFFAVIFLIGALGIMGVPLFNGYLSKTMLHEAILEYIKVAGLTGTPLLLLRSTEWIFLLSGGMTVAYMTKLFVALFVEKNEDPARQAKYDEKKHYASPLTKAVLAVSALPILFISAFPRFFLEKVISPAYSFFGVEPLEEEIAFFSLESLKGAAISLGIGALLYLAFIRPCLMKDGRYVNRLNPKFDLEDALYRPVLIHGTLGMIRFFFAVLSDGVEWILVNGTLFFTLTVVRFFALLLDGVILFLNKTVLRSHTYVYREETFAERVGGLLERLTKRKNLRAKTESVAETVSRVAQSEYNSFSFAFAMISLGVIIVLLFAVFG